MFDFFRNMFSGNHRLLLILLLFLSSCNQRTPSLLVFSGSASMPATEEAAKLFEKETGITVHINFGGSGTLLSQMILAKTGDIYFPGSSDYMDIALKKGIIDSQNLVVVAYLIPCINVAKGNPKNIRHLSDLARDDIRFVMANPENVCLGSYSVELIENNCDDTLANSIRGNILTFAESCSKTAATLSLHSADAILGWQVFGQWDPENIENIALPDSQLVRIGLLPLAITRYSKNKENAKKFIRFMASEEARKIYQKHHYIVDRNRALKIAGDKVKMGGAYLLPERWKQMGNED